MHKVQGLLFVLVLTVDNATSALRLTIDLLQKPTRSLCWASAVDLVEFLPFLLLPPPLFL